MNDAGNQKPTIDYPCRWGYKVIGQAEAEVRLAIGDCLRQCLGPDGVSDRAQIEGSRSSGGGKYVSVSLAVQVESEAQRNTIFQALANHPGVKLVI